MIKISIYLSIYQIVCFSEEYAAAFLLYNRIENEEEEKYMRLRLENELISSTIRPVVLMLSWQLMYSIFARIYYSIQFNIQ